LQAEQKLARQRLAQLNGFWNYFRRRRAVEEIHARDYRLVEATAQISKLEAEVAAIEAEPPPLFAGLSVDGRRAINVAVIAYAEMLYDRLAAGGLAELARQSTLKRVFDAHYGAPQACHELMQRAAKAAGEIEGMSEDLAEIKARADRLRRQAAYRKEEETVPAPESIAAIDSGATGKRTPNVLLDEYWEIYRALVR
jgi:hypothetical protein